MTIKRVSSNAITLENSQDKSLVTLKSLDGQILVKVSNGSKDVEIAKPGDYEYFGTNITAIEIPDERYSSVINLVRIGIEGISLTFLTKSREIPKDILSNLANIDALIIPILEVPNIKSLVASIEPKKLVLLKGFNLGSEVEHDSIKKTLGVQNLEETNSIKYKAVDFDLGDEVQLTLEILA